MATGELIIVLDKGGAEARWLARRVRDLNVFSVVAPWTALFQDGEARDGRGLEGVVAALDPEGGPLRERLRGIVVAGGVKEPGSAAGKDEDVAGDQTGAGDEAGDEAVGDAEAVTRLQGLGVPVLDLSDGLVVVHGDDDGDAVGDGGDDSAGDDPDGDDQGGDDSGGDDSGGDHSAGDDGIISDDDLRSFLYEACGCTGRWTMANYAEQAVQNLRRAVGSDAVLCGLSGGVDSAVAATLVHKAVGDQLVAIFVDHGLLRKGEADQVRRTFKEQFNMRLVAVDAAETFLSALQGVTDPEAKRKIIGERFIRTFEEEARKLGDVRRLVQGTLYTDVMESGAGGGQMVKSHHNVGGLPEDMNLDLVEPLKHLFKDEVRALGTVLGLPDAIVQRHPFPGPGLAIRIVGEVTKERLEIVREADCIVLDEIRRAGLESEVFQAFAALTDTRTVGVTDQARTYGYMLGVRAVTGADGLDAHWARLPHDVLDRIASRIMAELPAVNRVVYDISSKPPATIEWE